MYREIKGKELMSGYDPEIIVIFNKRIIQHTN